MSNPFLPNFKNRNALNLNRRFRSNALSENGYKNTGHTKVGEWYDWLQQGIVSLFGTGLGTAFLNSFCESLGFEEQWFHLRKKQQHQLILDILKAAENFDTFPLVLADTYGLSKEQIDEFYRRMINMHELLEHDLSFQEGNIEFDSSIGPYGISLNDPMLLIGTDKKYDPILFIFWQAVPKNRNLNSLEFKDLIYGKFNVLINFGGDARLISLNQSALDTLKYNLKKVYYNQKERAFIKDSTLTVLNLLNDNRLNVDTNLYTRIYIRKEVSQEEDQKLSTYVCSVLQEYTIKTGKTVPIAFWYMPKNSPELLKRKEDVYFLGTSRDKHMNRFVYVFKISNAIPDVNVVNDSIELFQILAVEIPLSFLENNAPPGPVINAEEIQMV